MFQKHNITAIDKKSKKTYEYQTGEKICWNRLNVHRGIFFKAFAIHDIQVVTCA